MYIRDEDEYEWKFRKMGNVDIHADDYAQTLQTSEDILDCIKAGKLDSISIVPNMECFLSCMELLKEHIPQMPFLPKLSVHVNLVEGKSLSNPGQLMTYSWVKLFAGSYSLGKKALLKDALKREVKVQIEKVQTSIADCILIAKANGIPVTQEKLRIDSHQHSHMIPVVWEAITEVIEEEHWEIEYIRNSKEPFWIFCGQLDLWKTYKPVNFIKNIILNMYSQRVDAYCEKQKLEQMYLWGLVMSGHMDQNRVSILNEKLKKKAGKNGRVLEILFHPGSMGMDELTEEISKEALPFYLSDGRKIEKEAVLWYEK